MTQLLEQAMTMVRSLPADQQDNIARIVLTLVEEEAPEPLALSSEEKAAIARSKNAAARGEFASEQQVQVLRAKY